MDEQQGNAQQKPEGEEDQGVGFALQADYRTPSPTFYANFALVSHTSDDLCRDFCLVGPPYNANLEAKTIPVPVVTRVIIPPGMAEGLVEALRIQIAKQRTEREAERVIIPIPVQGQEADSHDKP